MSPNIEFPTVNIMIGTTPTLVAMELMDLLTPHHPIDRHKVAFLFLDTQAQDVELTRFIAVKREIFDNIESLPLYVPIGMDKAPRYPQEGDSTEPHTFIGNWIPNTGAAGAAGVRNNGHISLAVSADRIAGTIAAMIGRVMQALPNDPNPPQQTLYVNIIAFLGGGTGSGILNDIAVLVQEIGKRRGYSIRVFIHGLLPFPDTSAGFAMKQKNANTTATLLELLALSMATTEKPYTKYLRRRPLTLGTYQIPAAGIYLYAQQNFPSVNDLTRAMGLNLYLFTTNHTGVGQAIAATFVSHVANIAQDNRGLTTVFCSSCSLAAWMPTLEISKAFALKFLIDSADEFKTLGVSLDAHLARLGKEWANAPGREGRLERPHLFQISLFDSPYLIQDRARLVETLLYPAVNEQLPHWPDGAHSLDANTRQALVRACLQEVGYPQNDKIAQQYVANITQYFTDQYGEALGKLNMFDILRIVLLIGPGQTNDDQNASITQIISEHVDNRFELVGPMFNINPDQLIRNQTGFGLIVGVQTRNQNDETLFTQSVQAARQRYAQLPNIVEKMDSVNPHILEINMDIHGISMSSMLDFNERYTSMMSKLLMMIEAREKGINPIPQYTSDEMRRLIEDPMALPPYTDENGVVQYRKLYDRVIRD